MTTSVATATTDELGGLAPVVLPSPVKLLSRYRSSCWDFAQSCVWTLDETDKNIPVKKYPTVETHPHLPHVMRNMVEETLYGIVKHRRLLITWTAMVVALWDAMFFEGRSVYLISKKEEDSDDLVNKCRFIYDNIPEEVLPLKPKLVYKYTEINFPEIKSKIKGIAQGADQLRQYTCSRIFCDEMGFWQQARETYTAFKPTLEGGGKVTVFSTRFPGFFKKLIEDTLDDDDVD